MTSLNDHLAPPEGSAVITARESGRIAAALDGDEAAIREQVRFYRPELTPAEQESIVRRFVQLATAEYPDA
jgi:hypothetical protein